MQQSTHGEIRVIPTDGTFGAMVTGVDARIADEKALLSIRDALLRHTVVVLRSQSLSPEDQSRFMSRLYPLRPVGKVFNKYSLPDHPAIAVVSNISKDGKPIGITDAGALWHTDSSFFLDPDLFASLYALKVPVRDGKALGATHFISTAAAYEGLSQEDKCHLEGMQLIQSYALSLEKMKARGLLKREYDVGEVRANAPDVVHSLIQTHPITGRRLLFTNEYFSASVVGMNTQDSDALLTRMFAHVESPRFRCTHHWQEGDFLLWDNFATQHLATFDYGDIPRLLYRCSTSGPRVANAFYADSLA